MTKAVFIGGEYGGQSQFILPQAITSGYLAMPVRKLSPPQWDTVQDDDPVETTMTVEQYDLIQYVESEDMGIFRLRGIVEGARNPSQDLRIANARVRYSEYDKEFNAELLAESLAASIIKVIKEDIDARTQR